MTTTNIQSKADLLDEELTQNQAKFNETTIADLTFKEIMNMNSVSRKGTFMDRTWKDKEQNILEDPTTTRWQKFKDGGYTIKNVTDRSVNSQRRKQAYSGYLWN